MYRNELEIPFQQNISERFLRCVNELINTERPGRIFHLTREPTKDELKFLTNNYSNEISLNRLRQNGAWMLTEGDYESVRVLKEIDERSDISVHYHSKENGRPVLPSLEDIVLAIPHGNNFIISHKGITYFSEIKNHPIAVFPGTLFKLIEVEELKQLFRTFVGKKHDGQEFNVDKCAEEFLKKMGVRIIRKPWNMLPNNPFSGFKIQ
jgi:hypothetical protein